LFENPKKLSKEVRTFVTDLASSDSVTLQLSEALMPSCQALAPDRQPTS
jgi:hypothetical protein